MDKLVVAKHNFEIAKERIGNFKLLENNVVERVKEKEFFGLFEHNVTGQEMNNVVVKIQKEFVLVNNSIKSIVDEFKDIYETFDVLDREYINGIIEALGKAGKAIEQNKETIENLEAMVMHQLNIEQDVKKLKKTNNQKSFNNVTSSIYYNIVVGLFALSSFVISIILLLSHLHE